MNFTFCPYTLKYFFFIFKFVKEFFFFPNSLWTKKKIFFYSNYFEIGKWDKHNNVFNGLGKKNEIHAKKIKEESNNLNHSI